eukprot:TRINITY_DN6775_c0_g1_i1.p1 TRINITY_DN6775_c0_g1~~TRINITY_DN6775_c0_g1_i1.p1  ORF type:complete len:229 (-),score=21.14 TRINITY_DN6775_c0_g1_i1:160-846(-)
MKEPPNPKMPIQSEIESGDKKVGQGRKRKPGMGHDVSHLKQGRWSPEEHSRYNRAFELYNKDWKKISESVGTRTMLQVKAHSQKLEKAKKNPKYKEKQKLIHDFLLSREKAINGKLQQEVPQSRVHRIHISKELADTLTSISPSASNPRFVLTKDHIKLLGINTMKSSFNFYPCGVDQMLSNPCAHQDLCNSMVEDEGKAGGEVVGLVTDNAIEYDISQPSAFMSLYL